MKSLPSDLILAKNKANNTDPWLLLLDLTLTDPDSTVLHFARNPENVYVRQANADDEGIVGQWKLNDNAVNTTVADDSSNTNNGASNVNTSTYSAVGHLDRCLDFAGVGNWAVVPDQSYYTFGNGVKDEPFSITIWLTASGLAPGLDIYAISKYEKIGDLGEWSFQLEETTGVMKAVLYDGANTLSITGSTVLTIDKWYYVVMTYDGSGSYEGLNIFIDGERETVTDGSSGAYTAMSANGTDVLIAGVNSGGIPEDTWERKMDEIRIYNRELKSGEIKFLYNKGIGTEIYSPLEYTRFNFSMAATSTNSTGQIPQIDLKVNNVTRLIQPYLNTYDGLVGSTVKLTIINAEYLMENYTELEQTWKVLKTQTAAEEITFTLGMPTPLKRFPQNKYYAHHCRFQFLSLECSYVGSDKECRRTIDDCESKGNSSRFGGFVGLASGNVRLA